jgi:hypothetical protein
VTKSTMEIAPPSREMDDSAIEALCIILDNGGGKWNGEAWSTILRRRLKNVYDDKLTGRAQWMYTHFHLSSIIDKNTAVAHVAKTWNRKSSTISTHANRKQQKDIALQWIDAALTSARQKFPDGHYLSDNDVYKMLDRLLTQKAAELQNKTKVKRRRAKLR